MTLNWPWRSLQRQLLRGFLLVFRDKCGLKWLHFFQIFDFKAQDDHEIGVRGHAGSSRTSSPCRAHVISYRSSMLTLSLSCMVNETQSHLSPKSQHGKGLRVILSQSSELFLIGSRTQLILLQNQVFYLLVFYWPFRVKACNQSLRTIV